jgi:hypothetical protein
MKAYINATQRGAGKVLKNIESQNNFFYWQASSCSCQHCWAFIAPLPISRSVQSSVAYREKQHSNCKNFSVPLATGSKFVHCAVANSCV